MKKIIKKLIMNNCKRIEVEVLFFRLFFLFLSAIIFFPNSFVLAQSTQGIIITGSVTDASTGNPLPGANIVIEGTFIGAITDLEGKYSITIPNEEAVLVFSYVGYETQSLKVGNLRQVSVSLKSEAATLEEVIVVGYGVQKKESVVGAVSQATGETIRQNVQGGDLRSGLAGSVPGLITLRTTGRPGGADFGGDGDQPIVMYIRGQKTWNNAQPLVLVDGVERDLHNINPYEIEKISVLKDASATAVFGVKGANGVILITTQRGHEGKTKLTFDYRNTVKTLSRVAEKARAYEANLTKNWAILNEVGIREASWLRIKPEAWVDYYKTNEYPEYFPDINWLDETMKDYTIDQNMNLTMSGGTKFVKYFNSVAFLDETDLINQKDIGQGFDPSFNFKRLNVRSNLDFTITPTTTLSTNLSGIYYNQKRSRGGLNAFRGIWNAAPDIWPIKYRDGTYAENVDVVNATNVPWEWNFSGYTLWKGTQVNTDFILKQNLDFIIKGFSAQGKLSYDNLARTSGAHVTGALPMTKFIDPAIVDDPRFRPDLKDPELAALEAEYTTWNVTGAGTDGYDWTLGENSYGTEAVNLNVDRSVLYEFSLNYNRDFNKHTIGGLALVNRQITARGSEFASYREDWVGRVTYSYDRRYLFEANAAYNGSEKFDRKYRFGFFPSIALGWVASNENFFIPIKSVMNNLKFRYSDGTVGSDAGIQRWLYTSSWIVHPEGGAAQTVFYFGYPSVQRSYPMRYEGVIANPDIHWETARKRDIGVETGFFNNLLKINFDYFIENRSDIFVTGSDRFIPYYFGANPVSANIGKVNVNGWEFEAEIFKSTQRGFSFWASYAWAFAKDKIIYAGDPEFRPDYQKRAGYPINQRKVILQQGNQLFQTWNDIYVTTGGETGNESLLPGETMRIDYNSDGIINNNDIAPYGFPGRPQFSYSPSAGVSYKGLSANIRFYGVYNVQGGVGMREMTSMYTEGEATVSIYSMKNAWSPERNHTTNASFPVLRFQSASLSDADDPYSIAALNISRAYFRLESAEIAYTLNNKNSPWIKKLGLSNVRLSLSGNNLFLISDMLTDIDYAGEGTADYRSNYPILKRYNFGVSIDF